MSKKVNHLLAAILALTAASNAAAQEVKPDLIRSEIPSTVSPAAHAGYEMILEYMRHIRPASSLADIVNLRAGRDAGAIKLFAPFIEQLGTRTKATNLGGVNVLEVSPRGKTNDGALLIYVHGGGFTYYSARSTLVAPALMAAATGMKIISVDYTLAPEGNWRTITDQVLEVYKALLSDGRPASSIGLFGDSAGGAIIAGSMLKARDEGLPLPGGLVLISPVSDLTMAGDTHITLAEADPIISAQGLRPGYDAYASRADQTNPYVSPVYGDFSKGFPPTLIQGGTREVLLSDFVRLNSAIKEAGGNSELDVYEGMIHAFPNIFVGSPEQKAATAEAASFWRRILVQQDVHH